MNKKLAVCLLAVVLLVGGVLFLVAGGREGAGRGVREASSPAVAEAPAPETELAQGTPTPVAAAAAREAAPEPERAAGAMDASGTPRGELAGLTGRVVESDGEPVAGMRVALLEFEGSLIFDGGLIGEGEPSLELEETVTDAKGRFLLGGAGAQALHALGVDLGGARATIRVLDHALVHRERTDVGDVVLAPFGVLTGRVVDEGGAPIAGARVRCGPFPPEILQGQPQEFRADSLVVVGLMAMGGEGHVVIELPAWVSALVDRLPVPTTQSAADGTFRLAGVALAQVIGGADRRGLVGATFGPLDLTGGAHDLGDVVLKRGRTVRGVVEDSSGEPVAGAEVYAGAELVPGIVAVLQPCGPSDENGRFELGGVAQNGQIVASARRARHEPWSTSVSPRHEGLLIELESVVQLLVNVRDEAGQPVSDADLRLTPARDPEAVLGFLDVAAFLPKPPSPPGAFAEIEPGRYLLRGIGAGHYEVRARVPGFAPGFTEAHCTGAENEVTLFVSAGRRLELTVLEAGSKEPIAGARASVLRASGSGFAKLAVGRSDVAGRALLGPLADIPVQVESDFMPDETVLLVQHPRHGEHSLALEPGVTALVVELQPGGALAGRVHWGGAVPTRIYMLTLDYRGAEGFLELFHLPRFSVTDLAGEFRCANLAPGKYGVSLSERFLQQDPLGLMAADFEPPTLHRAEIEIRNGETTELVIDLTPTGRGATARVVGHVRFDGRNLEGAQVTVSGNGEVQVATDARGRFETPEFSVLGTTQVRIEGEVPLGGGAKRHMQLHAESLELAQDDVHEIELDLYPIPVHARVVADASGEPVPEASVSARIQEQDRPWSQEDSIPSDGAGEVELLVLEPGSYLLTATAEGFSRAQTTVSVSAEGTSEPALLRLPRSVVCAGRVEADPSAQAGPVRFAYLWVRSLDNSNSSGARLEQPDNTFALEGLPPGKYQAHIYLGGRQGQEVTFELGPEGDEDLVLVFTAREE